MVGTIEVKVQQQQQQRHHYQQHQQREGVLSGGVNFRSVQPTPRSWNRENFVTGVGVLDIGAGLSDKKAGGNFRPKKSEKYFDGSEGGTTHDFTSVQPIPRIYNSPLQ